MKKVLVALLMILGVTTLSGCDLLGGSGEPGEGLYLVYYDSQSSELVISYDYASMDAGDLDKIIVEGRNTDGNSWFTIFESTETVVNDYRAYFRFPNDGSFEIKVTAYYNDGAIVDEVGSMFIDVVTSTEINHLEAHYEEWLDAVYFDINTQMTNIGYVEVVQVNVETSETTPFGELEVVYENPGETYIWGMIQPEEEGTFTYLFYFYSENGDYLGEYVEMDQHVDVWFPDQYSNGEINLSNLNVGLAQQLGLFDINWDFDSHPDYFTVEVSLDNIEWQEIAQLRYFDHHHVFFPTIAGNYYFRVNAYVGTDIVESIDYEHPVFFDPDTAIYSIDLGTDDYEGVVYVHTDVNSDFEVVIDYKFNDGEYIENPYGDEPFMELYNVEPGLYTIRIRVFNELGEMVEERIQTRELFPPNPLRDVNAHVDSNNFIVFIDAYVEDDNDNYSLLIERTNDEGVTWEEIAQMTSYQLQQYGFHYYEYNEGTYMYKISLFDADGNLVGVKETNYVQVELGDYYFAGDPSLNWFNANFNFWIKAVEMQWEVSGDFDEIVLLRSLDKETWEELERLPRIAEIYIHRESEEGTYYYKMQIFNDGVLIQESDTIDQIEVTLYGPIHNLHYGFDDYEKRLFVNFELNVQDYEYGSLRVEKSFNGSDFEVLFEDPNWVNDFYLDDAEFGDYQFKFIVKDNYGNIKDEKIIEYTLKEPDEIRYLHLDFNDDYNQYLHIEFRSNHNVDRVEVYKSFDSGDFELFGKTGVDHNGNYLWFGELFQSIPGTYQFKVVAFNVDGEIINEKTSEIKRISAYTGNWSGTPNIHEMNAWYNYEQSRVQVMFNAEGDFDHFLVEKSTDGGTTWVEEAILPRYAYGYTYREADGTFEYRLHAVDADGNIVDTFQFYNEVIVKENMLFTHINVWSNYEDTVISWDRVHTVNVDTIEIYYKTEFGEYILYETVPGEGNNDFNNINLLEQEYMFKLVAYDVNGNELDSIESSLEYIHEKNIIDYFWVNFNNSYAKLDFSIEARLQFDMMYRISYTADGGLTWVVYDEGIFEYQEEWHSYLYTYSYNALPEGELFFKVEVLDNNGVSYGNRTNNEHINYRYYNAEDIVEVNSLNTQYHISENKVRLYFNRYGEFDHLLIEKSVDGINFETVEQIHFTATEFMYTEEVVGNYYYRVSAVSADGTLLSSDTTENTTRVNPAAVIEWFNAWDNYPDQVELHWNLVNSNVATLTIQRSLNDAEFIDVATVGPLMSFYTDTVTETGFYTYKLVVKDANGNILDEQEFTIEMQIDPAY